MDGARLHLARARVVGRDVEARVAAAAERRDAGGQRERAGKTQEARRRILRHGARITRSPRRCIPRRPRAGQTKWRRVHSAMAMPAATVTGNEWLMPYIGMPTTRSAAATSSSGTPVVSLPKSMTQSSGRSACHRSTLAASFSKTTSLRPWAHAREESGLVGQQNDRLVALHAHRRALVVRLGAHEDDLPREKRMGHADDGAHVERIARAQDRDRQRPAQAREAPADLGERQLERGDLHGFMTVRAGPGSGAVAPTIVVRNGTGMKIATKTTTMSQKSALRLGASGWSSTGGWLPPPEARRTTLTSTYHTSQGTPAPTAIETPRVWFHPAPASTRTR